MNNNRLVNNILQGLLMAAVIAAALPMPSAAFAQDLAATVTRLTGTELTNVPDVIDAVFYIGGAAYTGAGLLKIKQHADNPTQVKLGEGIGRISTGAAMLALPYLANTVVSTFGFGQTTAPYAKFSTVQ